MWRSMEARRPWVAGREMPRLARRRSWTRRRERRGVNWGVLVERYFLAGREGTHLSL